MDTRPHIRIAPPACNLPLPAAAPLETALRWDAPFEDGGTQPAVTVFVTQPAYARINVHASSDLDNEVGGILVGEWCVDSERQAEFLVISSILPARYTRQSSVHLTFTQDSLVHFHEVIERRFAGKQIVGWYHTHPRMGIFLSSYDTWLHDHFFPEAWQVALVVDPYPSIGGFFIRQNGGVLDPARYCGFYEVTGGSGRSKVHWQNLSHSGQESEK